MSRPVRLKWFLLALALVCLGLGAVKLRAQSADPVEEMRQLLEKEEKDREKFPAAIEDLQKLAAALETIPEFLAAAEIRGLITSKDPKRKELLKEQIRKPLETKIKKVVQTGGPVTKLALAARLGDIKVIKDAAIIFRDADKELEEYRQYILLLSGELEKLIHQEDSTPQTRQAAARGLANLLVKGPEAVAALKSLFVRTAIEKRAAADALAMLVQSYANLSTGVNVIVTEKEALKVFAEVVLAATAGLPYDKGLKQEDDVAVRLSCLQALVNVGKYLNESDLLAVNVPEKIKKETVLEAEKDLEPILKELGSLLKDNHFLHILKAPNAPSDLRLLSLKLVESLATVRLRLNLRREYAGLPLLEEINGQDFLLPDLTKAIDSFSSHLNSPQPELRLAAVEFLERIGKISAAPAAAVIPTLTTLVKNDKSLFVRWAAVRALRNIGILELVPMMKKAGKMPSQEPLSGVVLGLASALGDPDLDVRITAAETLGDLAYLARSAKEPADGQKVLNDFLRLAVPALVKAAQVGDGESRVPVLRALGYTGVTDKQAPAAVEAMVTLLKHEEAKVRKAAAETLGRFGAQAKAASPALQQAALSDEDDAVRRAASDALLKIQSQ